MTPLAGFVIAIAAGLLLRSSRQAMLATVPPYLAVLVAQTWFLGSGIGHNPASTISGPGYWIVQVLVLLLSLGVAALFSAWRTRRLDGDTQTIATPRLITLTGCATVVAGVVGFAIPLLSSQPSSHSHHGNGSPPLAGVLGLVVLVFTLIVLAALKFRARQATAKKSVQVARWE